MTNGDTIRFFRRFMNSYAGHDEELAKENICPYDREETCQDETDCITCRLKWLKQEAMPPAMAFKQKENEDAESNTEKS